MDHPTDFEAILKQTFEAQQKQLASQNRLIKQMEERAAARDPAYEDLQFKHVTFNASQPKPTIPPTSKKGKMRASTGSIPTKTSSNPRPMKPSQTRS
ncbi:hypothetical protein CROQUDRAFT_481208 [Cronartium quercuum f. sp. fusiforme G11]|uniref:Uncharacterized protein n=1 Tax=Cronartium quercuum f. sp. fusiforme G11 TaxID=708437 RepID=A0A9P6NNA7_9BASI|nr:hypothetical protein CROQUDRAFT_481208 [Cronartium quercuum f. sp. fusiforme G11]